MDETYVRGVRLTRVAKVSKPFVDISEARVALRDSVKEAPCVDNVAHTIVQVGCHVPLTQVVLLNALRHAEHRPEHLDRFGDLALVGKRSRGNDAPFGQCRRVGGCTLQLFPNIANLCPTMQRAVRIGEDRQHRSARRVENARCFEFVDDRSPLLLPIRTQSCQFVDEGHSRQLAPQSGEQSRCLGKALAFECIDRLLQTLRCRLRLTRSDTPFDVARRSSFAV